MGLFDIFKRKNESIDFNGDIVKLINKGLLFEDGQQFLFWNEPVSELKKRITVSEKLFADRAVYNWGEQTILKGLKLPLTTIFWYHKEESAGKPFRAIEYFAEGNEIAEEQLLHIKKHLNNIFNIPVNQEITDTSTYLEWIAGDVKFSLYCFEKYGVKKLKFEISKL